MRNILCMFLMLMFSATLTLAQNAKTITGTIVDKNGQSIDGASITIKGTSAGTSSTNGSFSLSAKPGDVLLITALNFADQEVSVDSKNSYTVTMLPKDNVMTEVVVTALGISREKKSLGYAVQTVKDDELNRAGNPNLATAIQGKVAGVEVRPSSGMPGASAQIFIRGARFFDGNNAPLYVIDGMPINSNPDFEVGNGGVVGTDYSNRGIDLNPADIESINVLKGQAAAALYGMRASNGVIMITTKTGKGAKSKPTITFSTTNQWDQISRLPDEQTTYAAGSGGSYNHFGSFTWGPEIATLPDDPKYGGNTPNAYNGNNPTADTKGKYWSPQKNAWVLPQVFNNPKNFFQTGFTTSNNVGIAQAGNLGNYSVGLGMTKQDGIIPSTGMVRYTARFAGNYDVSPKVKVGASANLANTEINKIPTGNNSILFQVYGAPINYDLMGTPYHEADNPYKQISYRGGSFDNPLWSNANNNFKETTKRVFGNTYISYSPIKDLNIRWQIGIDQYSTDLEEIYELGSAPTGGLTARAAIPSPIAPSGGSITNGGLVNTTVNSLLNIGYKTNLNNDLRLTANAGGEFNNNYQRFIQSVGNGFNVGGWHNMANTSVQTGSESKYYYRTVGFFGNVGLDWRNMLFLNVTGRYDIVSNMPSDNRSFFYPSASLGWVFTELPTFKDNKSFYGKLRFSYAEVGAPATQYINNKVYIQGATSSGFLSNGIVYPFAGVVGYRPNSTLYDPGMKPQNTQSIEAGVELRFFNNRLGLDASYVRQNTKDQIFKVPLAGSTGFAQIYMNSGEMLNNVYEVALTSTPVQTKNFTWNLNANFSKVESKVVSLAEGVDNISLGGFTDPQVRAAIGYSYPSIFGTTFARNKEGQMLIDDTQGSDTYGMPISGSDGVIGSITPNFLLGVTNSLTYKSFRLSFLVDWKNGGQMYSGSNRLMDLYGTSIKTGDRATAKILYSGVKASTVKDDNTGGLPNDIVVEGANNIQTLYNSVLANISEANVYKNSFVKLREVSFGFDFPKEFCKKTGFLKAATITLSARNFLLWTELPNFDPESSQGNGNMQSGFDYMSLPQTKSYGIGLNLTF